MRDVVVGDELGEDFGADETCGAGKDDFHGVCCFFFQWDFAGDVVSRREKWVVLLNSLLGRVVGWIGMMDWDRQKVHVTKSRVMRMGWDGTRSCKEGMRG